MEQHSPDCGNKAAAEELSGQAPPYILAFGGRSEAISTVKYRFWQHALPLRESTAPCQRRAGAGKMAVPP